MEKHLKNVLVVSFGFLFLFTAYGGLQSLQSSLNAADGLGVASLSVVYAGLIISSMFLPPILIQKLGCKWTIVGSMCCYITYSLGNFHPTWATLIPTSLILGLGGAPLWSAKCTYLTIAANSYALKAGKLGRDVVNQYFGIFFLIFQSSGVWGNLISSLVFDQTPNKVEPSDVELSYCGAEDCTMTANVTNSSGTSNRPTDTLRYTLLGTYTAHYMDFCPIEVNQTPGLTCEAESGCFSINEPFWLQQSSSASGVLAVVIVSVFLDQLSPDKAENEETKMPSFGSTFLATFQHLKDKRQCLLIPLTMYSGFEQGFLAGDYTKSYVTCALGINWVGYVMICFSAANSLSSMFFGKISQYTGRKVLFALGAILNLGCVLAFLLWKPNPQHLAVFFILPALWGVADAIWQTQTNALYSDLFEKHKEAAFANYRLWESLGFVIAFGYSTFLCVYIKLYIVLAVLVVAMVLYGIVEYLESKSSPATPNPPEDKPIEFQQKAKQTQ